MKILGIAVGLHGDGHKLTIEVFLPRNEILDGPEYGNHLLTAAAGAIESFKEFAEGEVAFGTGEVVSRDTKLPADSPEYGKGANNPAASDPTPAAEEGTRRRRSAATTEPSQTGAATTTASTSSGDASGTPRRRQPAGEAAPLAPAAEAGATRRRRATADAAPSATPTIAGSTAPTTTQQSPTPAATGRRRTATVAEPSPTVPQPAQPAPTPAETPSTTISPSDDGGYTDADIAKAASSAASVITPKVVMEILAEFGVASTDQLKGADRAEFVKVLMDEIKKQS